MAATDEEAFRGFVVSRRGGLRHAAYLMCGDWHQADDLVQTTFTKLYVAWRRVRTGESADAYTRRILLRAYLDERRRPWRRESPSEVPNDLPGVAPPIDDRLDLLHALSRLPRRQRATLVLRFWQDASVAETADALGCSEGTVKSQTARALRTLRALLGDSALVLEETT